MLSLSYRALGGALALAVLFGVRGAATAQDVPKGDVVAIKVRLGDEEHWIQIRLDEAAAPRHCANFKILAEGNIYAGMAFHRVIRDYLVQAGDPLTKDDSQKRNWGTGGVGYDLAPEIGLPHKRGSVGMARLRTSNPKKRSSGSQFYIMLTNASELDKDYTVFGEVVEGLDIVGRMSRARADTNDAPVNRIEIVESRIGEPGILNTLTDPITKMPEKIAEIPNPFGGLRNPFAKKDAGEERAEAESKAEFEKARAAFDANAREARKAEAQARTDSASEDKPGANPFGGLRNPFAKKPGIEGDSTLEAGPAPRQEAPAEREISAPEATPASKDGGGFFGFFGRKDKEPSDPKPPKQARRAKGEEEIPGSASGETEPPEDKKPGPIGRLIHKIW